MDADLQKHAEAARGFMPPDEGLGLYDAALPLQERALATRRRVLGILTQADMQVIFIDTPGIFAPKRRLDRAMVTSAWGGAEDADAAAVLDELGVTDVAVIGLPDPASGERACAVIVTAEGGEALTQQEMADFLKAEGLMRDDAATSYSVLLGLGVQPYLGDAGGYPVSQSWYGAARPGGYGSIMWGTGMSGPGMGFGMGMRFPPSTSYRHEVSLLLRDLRNGQVVYETRAVHFGPWSDTLNILPALLNAALRDFPNPPAGPRKINIEIPR